MVAETGQRVGQREPHRLQRRERRALVERDREQRADERHRERRRALPQDDEHQRRRRHERERRRRLLRVVPDQLEERLAGADGEHRADQHEVDDPVVEEARRSRAGRCSAPTELSGICSIDEPGRERGEREHRAVVGDAQRRAVADQVRDRRPAGRDDHAGLPAEEQDRGDREDEAERDAAGVDALDGHREALGEDHAEEEPRERCDVLGRVCASARRRCTPPEASRPPPRRRGPRARELWEELRWLLSPPRHGRCGPRIRAGASAGRTGLLPLDHHRLPSPRWSRRCYQAPQPKFVGGKIQPSEAARTARPTTRADEPRVPLQHLFPPEH